MTSSQPPRGELVDAAERLRWVELTAAEWEEIGSAVEQAITDLASDRTDRLEPVVTKLTNTAFRAQVRDRLGSTHDAPAVVPTKPSRALPGIGLVCAAMLMALGWALGGMVVLIGTAGFALFIFAVAIAGTRSVANRRAGATPLTSREPVAPVPPPIRDALSRLTTMIDDTAE